MSALGLGLEAQRNVLGAIMLRDMQSRFGGKYANYLFYFLWPCAHLAVLLAIYHFLGRKSPFGNDLLFFWTGIMPFLTFAYPLRQTVQAAGTNAPLLGLPRVKFLDILFARTVLEMLTSTGIIVFTGFILYATGNDVWPKKPDVAIAALLGTMFFSVSWSILNAVISSLVKFWNMIVALSIIGFWASSGVLFWTKMFPDGAQYALSWMPLAQSTQWFRSAYFIGYGDHYFSPSYLLFFSLLSLALGLLLEFYTRRLVNHG